MIRVNALDVAAAPSMLLLLPEARRVDPSRRDGPIEFGYEFGDAAVESVLAEALARAGVRCEVTRGE